MCSIDLNFTDLENVPVVFTGSEMRLGSWAQWYFSTSLDWVTVSSSRIDNEVTVFNGICKSCSRLTWLVERVVWSVAILFFMGAKYLASDVQGKVDVKISSKVVNDATITRSAEMVFGEGRTVKYIYEKERSELKNVFHSDVPSGDAKLVKRYLKKGFVAEGEFDENHMITRGTIYKDGKVYMQGTYTLSDDRKKVICTPYHRQS